MSFQFQRDKRKHGSRQAWWLDHTECSRLKPQAQSREREPRGTSKPSPSDIVPPARHRLLGTPPKKKKNSTTNREPSVSNTWAYAGHLIPTAVVGNPQRFAGLRKSGELGSLVDFLLALVRYAGEWRGIGTDHCGPSHSFTRRVYQPWGDQLSWGD